MIIEVSLSIDTCGKRGIGATEVYGISELKRVLETGARSCNYDLYFDHKVENNNNIVIAFLSS